MPGIARGPNRRTGPQPFRNNRLLRQPINKGWASRNAALVVGNKAALTTVDGIVAASIQRTLGFGIIRVDDDDAAYLLADLVVVCESVVGASVNTKYRNATMPVVILDHALNDDMDHISVASAAGGSEDNVVILNASHQMAAGLSGTVLVQSPAARIDSSGTAVLAASAQNIYSTEAASTEIVGYGYEAGATMQNSHVAEARRVFCGLVPEVSGGTLNANGLALLDAAILWAMGSATSQSLSLTASDSLAFSDSVSRVLTLARTLADSLGLSDAVTRPGTFTRTAADSLSFADAVAAAKVILRSASDSLGISDAVTRTVSLGRTAADSLGLSAAVTRTGTFVRTASDSLGLSDAVTRTGTFLRTLGDTLSFADAVSGLKLIIRTAADSIGFSDAVTRGVTLSRTLADSLTIGNVVSRVGTFVRTTADSLSLATVVDAVGGGITVIVGGIPPAIASAVNAVVQAIANKLGPPDGGGSGPTPGGSASNPKPGR